MNVGLNSKTGLDVQAAFGQAANVVSLKKDAAPSRVSNDGKNPAADRKKSGIV